jgi:hypothetical protein
MRPSVPHPRDDMLARQPARGQRQEQRPEPDRADRWRGIGVASGAAASNVGTLGGCKPNMRPGSTVSP